MNIKLIETLFIFAGGVGMFLYGMNVMAAGLQKRAGTRMKNWLGALTKNKFLAISLGALITAVIQSSSATTVMIVGFVNAGLMNLTQAVGVIMGANVGTTITAWIVSMGEWSEALKPEFFAPFLIAIGSFTMLFTKSEKKKDVAEILIGFGFLFVGLSFMGDVIGQYSDLPVFRNAFVMLGSNPFLGILVGLVVTGIIQSSSASVGILQTLAMGGLVSWSSAVFITLGQNIGTCVTSLISSIGANRNAKRAAVIHLLFNAVGAIVFGAFFYFYFKVKPDFATSSINSVQISLFHTAFNLSNTLILVPFTDVLVKLSGYFVKEDLVIEEEGIKLSLLDDRMLENPLFALENTRKEIVLMGNLALENVGLAMQALLVNGVDKSIIFENEKRINAYTKEINKYLVKINNLSLTKKQSQTVNRLYNIINDIERVGDHAENLAELASIKGQQNIRFSNEAYEELNEVAIKTHEALKLAIEVLDLEDISKVSIIEALEDEVDALELVLRNNHLQRLSSDRCEIEIGVLFIDALINLERISDHALNVANYVKKENTI